MSSKTQEVVAVKALSKYGFQMGDGTYVNWSKGTKQEDKDRIIPGASFEMELFISDKGAKYLNSVGRQVGEGQAVVAAAPRPSAPVVQRDFDKEARGKTRCSLYAAALQSPRTALLGDVASIVAFAIEVADAGVAYTFGDGE